MLSIKKSVISFTTEEGAFVEKTIPEMTREELMDLCASLIQSRETIYAEKDAIVQTMNKFLAKDHESVLQKLLENNNETKTF